MRAAFVHGLLSVVFAVPLSYLVLDVYVSTTVSVMEDPALYETMFRGAMYTVGFGSFFSGFFSTLFTLRGR